MAGFDVIGLGVNVVDILLRMPPQVQWGKKQQVKDIVIQGGGPAATGSCVCAALGWRTGFITNMGENTLSHIARLEFQAQHILPDLFIEFPAARPCLAIVHVDLQTAERTIFYNLDDYHNVRPPDLPYDALKETRVFLIDGYETDAAEAVLQVIQGTPARSVIDLETGDPDFLRRLIALGTDIILPIATAQQVTGKETPEAVLRELATISTGQLVVTNGIEGSWALTPEGVLHQPAFQVDAVDTTGCGDVFHGAYAAGILEGLELRERLEFAAWIAAISACYIGGRAGIPTRQQLASLDQSMLSDALKTALRR
ncbi:ribokinase [candidate division KSB3 bacterium]|uniref:Ribokinase n=1 Tax=candidate division KSB3 bacterium TaxID=2044937 RepID=A0A9D5JUR6_9BACT|nr:ribokinase [candidate division KSB3 bacterium]MBD3324638.1 ribokinase [candidate division KSB3 bacterium]